MAPHSAAATSAAGRDNSPSHPSSSSAAVTGTTSATVIRSSPSMKFTRFTNHIPASRITPRSSASGNAGTMRAVSGAVNTTVPTAAACSTSRTSTGSDLMSSANPTSAIATVAPTSAGGIATSAKLPQADATSRVAEITAMPAPCGVGMRCEDRALAAPARSAGAGGGWSR